jgi:hypothetical protein
MYRAGTNVRYDGQLGRIIEDAGTTDQGQMYEVEFRNGSMDTVPESKLRYVPPSKVE